MMTWILVLLPVIVLCLLKWVDKQLWESYGELGLVSSKRCRVLRTRLASMSLTAQA